MSPSAFPPADGDGDAGIPTTRHRRVGAEFITVDSEILALRRCSCRVQFLGARCPDAGKPYLYRPPTAT